MDLAPLRKGIYEAQMTKLVQLLLAPSDVFIDIGGNEGYFSVIASSRVSNEPVHCVEHQSRLLSILHKNFELNGSKVILHETSISDEDGHLDLFLRTPTNRRIQHAPPLEVGITSGGGSIHNPRFVLSEELDRQSKAYQDRLRGSENSRRRGGQSCTEWNTG
jgi:FkbM family methyltransferase